MKADPARLEADVRALCAFSPRDGFHPENLAQAAEWIRGEMEAADARVSEQPFEALGRPFRNVLARLGPGEGERLVIGAHYDAFGEGPAADDNASGVAALLELARLMAGAPPPIPVELAAYAPEEPPFFRTGGMGSAVHAASLRSAGVKVRLMISLEMLGCFCDEPGSQRFPLPGMGLAYPHAGNFIAVVGRLGQRRAVRRLREAMRAAGTIPVESISAPVSLPGVDFSDHLSFWNEGYEAVMLTDTAFYRNPRYHTFGDTPDTLDYRRLAAAVDAIAFGLPSFVSR